MTLCVSGDDHLYTAVGICRCLSAEAPCMIKSVIGNHICRVDSEFNMFITISSGCSTLVPTERTGKGCHPNGVLRLHIDRMGRSKGVGIASHRGTCLRVGRSTRGILRMVGRFTNILPFSSGTSPRIVRQRFNLDGKTFGHTVNRLVGRNGMRVGSGEVCTG